MSIQAGKSTRAAKGRTNEDSVLVDKISSFYAVADGVSEEGKGSTASRQAVAAAESIIKEDDVKLDELVNRLRQNITSGATTFTGVRIKEKDGGYFLEFAHLGDSKAFLVRDKLQQLTHDDVGESGGLIRGLGREFEKIYKEKGIENEILPSYGLIPLQKGDKIVLASDGLDIDHETIKQIVKGNDPQKAADILVEKSGREDDVSAIVIGIDSKEKTYSGSKIAVCTGIALIAAAAGILVYRAYNRPSYEEPAALESTLSASAEEPVFIEGFDTISVPENYTVKKGDNLWNIVKEAYGLKDDSEIARKVNEIVSLNADACPDIEKDLVYADEKGRVRKGRDRIRGDLIHPGQELLLPRKQASLDTWGSNKTKMAANYSLDDLVYSYSKAAFRNFEEVKGDMAGFNAHVKEIAEYYAKYGEEKALDTYSMLNDDPSMLRKTLRYAWSELGCKIKTNLSSLSLDELRIIKDFYYSGTNKEALEKIRRLTGMGMSESTMYAALDRLGETDGRVYRKNIKEDHAGANQDVLA